MVLALAGCDRPEGAPAQPGADASAGAFKVDRSGAGTAIPSLTVSDPAGRKLDRLAGELEGEVKVVTVSQDIRGAEVVTPFSAKHGYQRLEPWLDPETALSAQFTPEGVLPLTILFDASGREILRVTGGYDWDSPEAVRLIRESLAAS